MPVREDALLLLSDQGEASGVSVWGCGTLVDDAARAGVDAYVAGRRVAKGTERRKLDW